MRWLSPEEHRAWIGYRRMRGLLDLRLARDLADDSGLSEADYDVLSSLGDSATSRTCEAGVRYRAACPPRSYPATRRFGAW